MNSASPYSLHTTLQHLRVAVRDFFGLEVQPQLCAVLRIAYALLVLVYLLVLYPDWLRWYGEAGVLTQEMGRQIVDPDVWSLFDFFAPDPEMIKACFWVMFAQAFLLLIGFASRFQAFSIFIWWMSLHHRNLLILDSEDTLIRLMAFYLALIPVGAYWSVDQMIARRWWGHQVPARVPGWGIRILQIQMVCILLSAGLSKLAGESWVNGTALYYVARLDDYFGRFYVPDFVFETPWIVAPITWSVIVLELSTPVLIWFKETRWFILGTLLLFHMGNDYCMHLFLFHWAMLIGWMSFLSWDDVLYLRNLIRKSPR